MKAKKSILTDNQKRFLVEFKKQSNLTEFFYLTGGTVLSEFYLRHRLSEDLDFFCETEFDPEEVYFFIDKVKRLLRCKSLIASKKNGREIFNLTFDEKEILKTEFFCYPYKNLKPLKKINCLFINSEFDIAVNKIFSVFTRNEAKDFVDLYFLLKKYSLNSLLLGVEKKFGIKLDKFTLGNEFYKARHITILPKMIKKLTVTQLISFFKEQAHRLGWIIF